MDIEIVVSVGLTTSKAVAWGGKAPELHAASVEAIRYAVSNNARRSELKEWLEQRTKMTLSIDFYLNRHKASVTDIDSLLSDLMNPLVEGACGPRQSGKPIPQTKDALFWRIVAEKHESKDEKVVLRIGRM